MGTLSRIMWKCLAFLIRFSLTRVEKGYCVRNGSINLGLTYSWDPGTVHILKFLFSLPGIFDVWTTILQDIFRVLASKSHCNLLFWPFNIFSSYLFRKAELLRCTERRKPSCKSPSYKFWISGCSVVCFMARCLLKWKVVTVTLM